MRALEVILLDEPHDSPTKQLNGPIQVSNELQNRGTPGNGEPKATGEGKVARQST